jgi:hypothetical protein
MSDLSDLADADFLNWLRDRLVYVYKEKPNVDFVLRLEALREKILKRRRFPFQRKNEKTS